MRLFFEITEERPVDIGVNKWRQFSRDGMAEVGTLYDLVFKPRHFQPGASSKYGYRPRSAAYIAKKRRAVARTSFSVSPDANLDLILTGALRRAINQRHIAQAFPTRVTVNMPSPSYAQMKPRRANMPNLGQEITTVAADELIQMEKVYKNDVEKSVNEFRARRVTRI